MNGRLQSMDRLVRHFGEGWTVVLRRRHSLRDGDDGVPATLALQGDHPAGSTSVTLAAPRLDGALPPGLRLVIGGSLTAEVAGPVAITAGGNALVGVPLAAALTADFPDGTPVAVEPSRDYTFPAAASQVRRTDVSGVTEPAASQVIVLSAVGALTVPRPEDVVVLPGRPAEEAIVVQAVEPGAGAAGWVIYPRGSAS